jgi:hemolysin III
VVEAWKALVVSTVHAMDQEVVRAVRPLLRGWLHLGALPLVVVTGVVLTVRAPAGQTRAAVAVFAVSAALLFGVSALYHRRQWGPRTFAVLQRFDHANIFLIIAGTYTPFAVLLLPSGAARTLLWLVWGGAVAGVAFRILWIGAPRWLYVPVYLALGWVAVVYLPAFAAAGAAVLAFVVAGGLLYTVGGLVYGIRRPDPSPRWFGFHEVFHALTVLAFASHCAGLALAVTAS